MTDPILCTTYRRADGNKIYSAEMVTDKALIMLNARPTPLNYIEEQWNDAFDPVTGDYVTTLVRWRTIRLGVDEKCETCEGEAQLINADPHYPYESVLRMCPDCQTGVKPRDTNPQWTETVTEPTYDDALVRER